MNFIKKIFQQRTTSLYNGEVIKEGDAVTFTNSDKVDCTDIIRRRENGTLYFFNSGFDVKDYTNARKANP